MECVSISKMQLSDSRSVHSNITQYHHWLSKLLRYAPDFAVQTYINRWFFERKRVWLRSTFSNNTMAFAFRIAVLVFIWFDIEKCNAMQKKSDEWIIVESFISFIVYSVCIWTVKRKKAGEAMSFGEIQHEYREKCSFLRQTRLHMLHF